MHHIVHYVSQLDLFYLFQYLLKLVPQRIDQLRVVGIHFLTFGSGEPNTRHVHTGGNESDRILDIAAQGAVVLAQIAASSPADRPPDGCP